MVNPAVSVSMWSLGKCSYTECFVRISGQMGGGLVAFPFFYEVSQYFGLEAFGGPEFSKENDVEAFMSEFGATFLLMWAIYIVREESFPRRLPSLLSSVSRPFFALSMTAA